VPDPINECQDIGSSSALLLSQTFHLYFKCANTVSSAAPCSDNIFVHLWRCWRLYE